MPVRDPATMSYVYYAWRQYLPDWPDVIAGPGHLVAVWEKQDRWTLFDSKKGGRCPFRFSKFRCSNEGRKAECIRRAIGRKTRAVYWLSTGL